MDDSSAIPQETADRCPACDGVPEPECFGGDVPCPHCGHVLWFVRRYEGDVCILTFLPGLTSGAESLERLDEVHSAIEGARGPIMDFSRLRIATSMLLGMLVALHKR